MKKLAAIIAVCAVSALGLAHAVAADANPAPEKKAAVKSGKASHLPFTGKLKAVDQTAKTITVGTRTFQITSQTKIFKNEKPATLEDLKVDEDIRGAYKTGADDKLEAISVYAGPKPEKTKK